MYDFQSNNCKLLFGISKSDLFLIIADFYFRHIYGTCSPTHTRIKKNVRKKNVKRKTLTRFSYYANIYVFNTLPPVKFDVVWADGDASAFFILQKNKTMLSMISPLPIKRIPPYSTECLILSPVWLHFWLL